MSVVVDGDHVIDDRPVRILGARVTLVPDRLAVLPAPQMLAVAGDVIVKSEAVRRQVLAAGEDAVTEVLLWGRAHPPSLNCKYIPVRHRPSAAAQVFKSHAMAAGERPSPKPPMRVSTPWSDRQPGLAAVTNCSERWVCCCTSTRPDDVNSSVNACRSNICNPITRAPAFIALRTGAGCPA